MRKTSHKAGEDNPDRVGARRRGKSARSRAGRPGSKGSGQFVQTAYGNWIRWQPPAPKKSEKKQPADLKQDYTSSSSTSRPNKKEKSCCTRLVAQRTRKLQRAATQQTLKIKALERKVADLRQFYSRREHALIREFKGLVAAARNKQNEQASEVQCTLALAAVAETRPADIDWQQFQDYCSRFEWEVYEGGFCEGSNWFECPFPQPERGYPESTTGTFYSSDVFHMDKDLCEHCMFEYYRRIGRHVG